MSRSIKKEDTVDKDISIKTILKLHEQFSHRKNIIKKLEENNIYVSNNKLKKNLTYCKICNEYDKKIKSKFSFIKTFNVGERVGCDILEIKKGVLIVNLIDYFSRKVFSKSIKNKTPDCIVEFLMMS
ncbi:hypothetical protein DMUE_3965 [Dictyocoela muelleri]|nr:hypothetical protein DMUE_3965 [Dictyocoela muelleri]